MHTHTCTSHTHTHTHACTCRPLEIPPEAQKLADEKLFELKGYRLTAAPEQTRPPRVVKVAVVQNAIVRPTSDPVVEQVRGNL